MFKRFWRVIRSWFGKFISSAEDPKTVLQQNLRDLQDKIPEMNQRVAKAKSNVKRLERQKEDLDARIKKAERHIKAYLQRDNESKAKEIAMKLEGWNDEKEEVESQLETAKKIVTKAKNAKKHFMREFKKKKAKIKDAVRQYERSEMQKDIADAMESFEVGGIGQTHDEMVNKLEEQTAEHEARLEMAVDSVDEEEIQIEEDAQEMRAEEIVEKFKKEDNVDSMNGGKLNTSANSFSKSEKEADKLPEKTVGIMN